MRRLLALAFTTLALVTPSLRAAEAPAGKIVYSRKDNGRWVLHVMNADGTGDRVLPGQPENDNLLPTWSPDGKKIAFTATRLADHEEMFVCVIGADGTGLKTFKAHGRSMMPAWSPSGDQIAFVTGEGDPEIRLASPDGENSFKLNTGEAGGMAPFWSRDGKKVGFTPSGSEKKQKEILFARADGSGIEPFVVPEDPELSLFAGPDGLSPDGKRLIYQTIVNEKDTHKTTLQFFEGGVKTVLLELTVTGPGGPEMFFTPAWAPDGKSFLASQPTDKGHAIFRFSLDGKTRTRLTPEGVDCSGGSWSPR